MVEVDDDDAPVKLVSSDRVDILSHTHSSYSSSKVFELDGDSTTPEGKPPPLPPFQFKRIPQRMLSADDIMLRIHAGMM